MVSNFWCTLSVAWQVCLPAHLSATISHPQDSCQAPLFHPQPNSSIIHKQPCSHRQRTRSQKMVNLIISVLPSCSYTSGPILTNLPWSRRKKGTFLDFRTTTSSPLCERRSLFLHFPWFLALNFTPTQDSTLSKQPPPSLQFDRPLELPYISSPLSSQLPLKPSVCSLLPRSIQALTHRHMTSVHWNCPC